MLLSYYYNRLYTALVAYIPFTLTLETVRKINKRVTIREAMSTADMQRAAFDAVDMNAAITDSAIAELVRKFGTAAGKQRLVDVAATVAEYLVQLGVETYGDLRAATQEIFQECGLLPVEAARLVAHFAPPEKVEKVAVAPRGVAQSFRAKKGFVAANRVLDPGQGHDVHRESPCPMETRQGKKRKVLFDDNVHDNVDDDGDD